MHILQEHIYQLSKRHKITHLEFRTSQLISFTKRWFYFMQQKDKFWIENTKVEDFGINTLLTPVTIKW